MVKHVVYQNDDMLSRAHFELKIRQDERKSHFFLQLTKSKLDELQSEFCPNPSELELFAGRGGSSIGSHQAFKLKYVLLANASLLRSSHPQAKIFAEDVRTFLDNCKQNKPSETLGRYYQFISSLPRVLANKYRRMK